MPVFPLCQIQTKYRGYTEHVQRMYRGDTYKWLVLWQLTVCLFSLLCKLFCLRQHLAPVVPCTIVMEAGLIVFFFVGENEGVKPHVLSAVCPFGFMCWLFQLVIENVGCYLSLKNQKILYIIDI